MIKLALIDLGEKLIHRSRNTPFPNAVAALEALSTLHTAGGGLLALGLVSDFLPADPPVTEARIAAREQEYDQILKDAGLGDLFQPFSSRVTLSTRAGVNMPDRHIFQRSGKGLETREFLT